MNKNLITRRQALQLRELGFHDHVGAYMTRLSAEYKFDYLVNECAHEDFNAEWWSLSIPTVDETIDWLYRKFNVIIANKTIPFVNAYRNGIEFVYSVKWCNPRDGWNGNKDIGDGVWSLNHYAAKRSAISIAIKWLNNRRSVATGRQKVTKSVKLRNDNIKR